MYVYINCQIEVGFWNGQGLMHRVVISSVGGGAVHTRRTTLGTTSWWLIVQLIEWVDRVLIGWVDGVGWWDVLMG